MHDFIYVTKAEAKLVREEIYTIIHEVQDIIREEYFTLQFRPVGSSSMNMITRDLKSNKGFKNLEGKISWLRAKVTGESYRIII